MQKPIRGPGPKLRRGAEWSSAAAGARSWGRVQSDREDARGSKERRATSERKIRANRANARASTGPKTAQGRSRAARNALRHALSLPVSSDPVLSEDVEALAREIIGTDSNAEIHELARRIAEAQIDLRRVRHARHQLFSQTLSDPDYESEVMLRKNRH
jgi:hypothetical protein